MENHPRVIRQKGAEAEREISFPVARVFFFPPFVLCLRANAARMPEVPSADFRQKRSEVRKWRVQGGRA